jgi:hypothetical protein
VIQFFNSTEHNIHAWAWLRLYFDKTTCEWWVLRVGCWCGIYGGTRSGPGTIVNYTAGAVLPGAFTVDAAAGTITIIEGGIYLVTCGGRFYDDDTVQTTQVIAVDIVTHTGNLKVDVSRFTWDVLYRLNVNAGPVGGTRSHCHFGTDYAQPHYPAHCSISTLIELKPDDVVSADYSSNTNVRAADCSLSVVKVDD